MFRAVVEEAAALASLSLFLGMIAIWAQVLAQRYGVTLVPANQGGTDFAQGGARVTDLPGVPASPPTGNATPIAAQISQLLARGPLDANALYSVWGGANDVFFQLGAVAGGAVTPAQAQANLAAAATSLVQQVGALQAVAPDFPGLPDDPPPLEFQLSDPDAFRRRLSEAGLEDVRVERTAERPAFSSGQELWDWVLFGNPIPGMLVADLGEDQRARLRQVLDGMLRERAGTTRRAVLTNAVNIGIGTKGARR